MEYYIEYQGLILKVTAIQNGLNADVKVEVVQGYMDLNAFYWSDGDTIKELTTTYAGKDSSLNMNGAGSVLDGDPVYWDAALKLSSTGLGSAGVAKSTYLTAGETYSFTLNNVNVANDMQIIGIRATSTSTAEGSIKAVIEGEPIAPPPVDHFEPWGTNPNGLPDISHITLYWDVADDDPRDVKPTSGGGDGWFTVKFDYEDYAQIAGNTLSQDLDDDIQGFLDFLVGEGQITEAEKSTLVGVSIKGGQVENWYQYAGDADPEPDPTAPAVWVVENKEIDVAYQFVDTNADTVPDSWAA